MKRPATDREVKPKRNDDDQELTDADVAQQDGVDNAIFELVQQLAPDNADNIEWDIHWIGELRDLIQHVIVDVYHCCDEFEFYPYLDYPSALTEIEQIAGELDAKHQRRMLLMAHALLKEQERTEHVA